MYYAIAIMYFVAFVVIGHATWGAEHQPAQDQDDETN